MDSQIWCRLEEKFGHVLVLRGEQVHLLKVTGLMLKRKFAGVVERLENGDDPQDVGAKVQTFEVGEIGKAEVSPSGKGLKLYRERDGAKIAFTSPETDADDIRATILGRTGRSFQPAEEEVGVIEALLPPAISGLLLGLFWMAVYSVASDRSQGKEVVVKGRRQGMQHVAILISDTLGYAGTLAVGGLILVVVVGWAASRLIHRPRRTAWLPAAA